MRQNSKTKNKAVSSVASEFVRTAMRRSSRNKVFAVIAVAVAAFTVFALVQPAVTLTYDCGMDEHIHVEECYTSELACDNQEPDHEHTDACYSKQLSCATPEHVHSDECTAKEGDPNQGAEPPAAGGNVGHDDTDLPQDAVTEVGEQTTALDERALPNEDLAGKKFVLYNKSADVVMSPKLVESGLGWSLLAKKPYSYEQDSAGNHHIAMPKDSAVVWTFVAGSDGSLYLAVEDGGPNSYKYLNGISDGGDLRLRLDGEPQNKVVVKQTGDGRGLYLENPKVSRQFPINQTFDGRAFDIDFWGEATPFIFIPEENVSYENDYVQGMTPAGTTVNLFDYWATKDRVVAGGDQALNHPNQGINAGHDLKFGNGSDSLGGKAYNKYTGKNAGVFQGIVKSQLADSYPALSDGESLAYLFDPSIPVDNAKLSFTNVGGMFQKDKDGYYVYDCQKNYARLNETTGQVTLYRNPGVSAKTKVGQFFPFDEYASEFDGSKMNHHFGMSLSAKFVQRNEGYIDIKKQEPMKFEFSGDDDVWIFIDGVLVADLGGIHDRAKVSIDFSNGSIATECGSQKLETTLKDQYRLANKLDATSWSPDGVTYADNTYHTLEFFYLERGAYASNLLLKYNLTSVPETVVEKVDQYGRGINGARFAVYAADKDYKYLDAKGGKPVPLEEGKYSFNDVGDIVNARGKVLVHAIYIGTIRNGKMVFSNESGAAYTLAELKELFGDNFILREYAVPEGYRITGEETHLKIDESNLLICENSYEGGSYTAANLITTATDSIWIDDRDNRYQGTPLASVDKFKKITYRDPAQKKPNGALFAVVMKYNGPALGPGDVSSLGKEQFWKPVYGSAAAGYQVVDGKERLIARSIRAAKEAERYGRVIFEETPSGRMEITLNNLPGDITSYYYSLDDGEKEKTRYSVAYYWTSAESLSGANEGNTWLVSADASMPADNSGFERVFGSVISVPNVYNRLLVQKKSSDENPVPLNGARFALYPVVEDEHKDGTAGTVYYEADEGRLIKLDANGSASVKDDPSPYTYRIDGESGRIDLYKDGGDHPVFSIHPAKNTAGAPMLRETSSKPNGLTEDGIASFEGLKRGKYALREVAAPDGYAVNSAESLVLVTRDAVYACAGTADDGVRVGRGPGYIVDTMREFATDGEVNTTLLWITTMLRGYTSKDGTYSFNDFYKNGDEWRFLKNEAGDPVSSVGANREARRAAMRAYLKYDIGLTEDRYRSYSVDTDAEYNQHAEAEYGGGLPVKARRLYTETGWGTIEIYQDYWFGEKQMSGKGAEYTKLHEGALRDPNLAKLFSRSVTVEFSDQQVSNLKVSKEVRDAAGVGGKQQFTFNFILNLTV